ncbi:uncharacterized protein LOC112683174 isoform X3 [Sipha flava]|uniref:Uncharacterized protein LOC112683174 isoform X3 n=1 Tax=Sipha flava TaxID=143950 RepID=A0A8B8FGJ1_9HEMI|nr:uncharacterized protein LOC112683174 isoform X3 [Sipha flava]
MSNSKTSTSMSNVYKFSDVKFDDQCLQYMKPTSSRQIMPTESLSASTSLTENQCYTNLTPSTSTNNAQRQSVKPEMIYSEEQISSEHSVEHSVHVHIPELS